MLHWRPGLSHFIPDFLIAGRITEIRVQRRQVAVILVAIATAGVRLPDFYQSLSHWLVERVHYAPGKNDALANGQPALIEIQQQIVVELSRFEVREVRAGTFAGGLRNADQGLAGRARYRSLVVEGQHLGVPVAVTGNETTGVLLIHVELLFLDL